HRRAARGPRPRPRSRPVPRRAVRDLARPVCPRGLGPEHRHRPPGARPARRCGARDAGARGHIARLELPARPRGRGLAVRRGPTPRHGALHHHRHPVRAAGLLARAHARHGVHVLGALAPRVRGGRARRRRAHGLEPPRRPAAALRAAARHAHVDRCRWRGAVRARRDARRHEPAVRENGRGQGIDGVPGHTTARCTKRSHSGRHAPGTLPASAVLGRGVRGGRVRMARGGPPPRRGRPGPRLPGGHGGHRGDGRVGRRGKPADRSGRRVYRPACAERETGNVKRLRWDRRAAFGIGVLVIVTGAALAAPLVSTGQPAVQRDIVATRFLPPLATDESGTFHPLGTDRFGRDVWTRLVYGAVALGLPRGRVLVRHILPNALTPVIVSAALGLGNAITLEAGLSFLGLGVQPPTPSWGNMIASGRDTLVNAPWVAAAPGIALVLVVVACTLVGDALQDALNPATRYQTFR